MSFYRYLNAPFGARAPGGGAASAIAPYLVVGITFVVFAIVFILPPNPELRAAAYRALNVSSFDYIGADSRTIEVNADCLRRTGRLDPSGACAAAAVPVKESYPDAFVPPLNYPPVWVYIYDSLFSATEGSFFYWWMLNALCIVVGILACLLRSGAGAFLFPLTLLAPPTVLCIERGNVDGVVFLVTIAAFAFPLPGFVRGMAIGLAAVLKIFPAFAAFPLLVEWRKNKWSVLGFVLMLPLIVLSLLSAVHLIKDTLFAFSASYGLRSGMFLLFIKGNPALQWMSLAVYGVAVFGGALVLLSPRLRSHLDRAVDELDGWKASLFYASIAVFCGTFILFGNWAYRVIFLIPALAVASSMQSTVSKVLKFQILIIFWVPLLPFGWAFFNLACLMFMPLALALLLIYFSRGISAEMRLRVGRPS